MGQVLHGSATTTHAIRAAIQRSKASIQALSERLRNQSEDGRQMAEARRVLEDCPMGPKVPHSTVLSADEETLIVAFRRHTLLPLDDCLYALQATIPHLTRSSLHRLFQRHGDQPSAECRGHRPRQAVSRPIRLGTSTSISRRSGPRRASSICSSPSIGSASSPLRNYTNGRLRRIAADFLRRLIERVPYTIHTVLTDNGFQFTPPDGGWRVGEISSCSPPSAAFVPTPLTSPAPSSASSIASPNSTIRGPTASRTDEPHHQGRHGPAVLLRRPTRAFARIWHVPRCLQLREAPQEPSGLRPSSGFVSSGQSSPNDSD